MRRFEFTEEQRQTVARERFFHPDPAVQRRMEILWLKLHGETHDRIAVLTDTSRRTVQRVLDCYNVLGAINAVTHELIRITNDGYITAETVCELLRKISDLQLTTPITLVLDNARYQRCKLVQSMAESLGIELLFLPSYSPNLNLIERLWKFVKKQALNSRRHADFAKFQYAINHCLDRTTTDHHAELTTLLAHKFQTFENVSILAG